MLLCTRLAVDGMPATEVVDETVTPALIELPTSVGDVEVGGELGVVFAPSDESRIPPDVVNGTESCDDDGFADCNGADDG